MSSLFQFLIVCWLQCAFRPQHWPSFLTGSQLTCQNAFLGISLTPRHLKLRLLSTTISCSHKSIDIVFAEMCMRLLLHVPGRVCIVSVSRRSSWDKSAENRLEISDSPCFLASLKLRFHFCCQLTLLSWL